MKYLPEDIVLPNRLLEPSPEVGETVEEVITPGAFGRSAYKEDGELRGCLKRPEGLIGMGAIPPPGTPPFRSRLLGLYF